MNYYVWFKGAGELVLDGVTLNMHQRSDYGSTLCKFAGTLVLTNGTAVTFSNNGNTPNGLGLGKAILAGCTLSGGNATDGTFGNSEIEVLAGTANTCTSNFPLPLDKVVVTGDVKDLRKAERTVLTTTKGSMTEGATLADAMKANGWKIRTVANKDGETIANYTVELFKSGLTIIFK